MSNENKPAIERLASTITVVLGAIALVSVALGSILFILYCMRVGHVPRDMSDVGGVKVFILVFSFGLVFGLFTVSMLGLGALIGYPLQKLQVWWLNQPGRNVDVRERATKLEPINIGLCVCSIFGAIFTFGLAQKVSSAYWQLPLVSLLTYFLYSGSVDTYRRLRVARMANNSSIIDIGVSKEKPAEERLRKGLYISACLFLMVPSLTAKDIGGELLDGMMRVAMVRVEKPLIYVREPYSNLLPAQYIDTQAPSMGKDFYALQNVSIIMHNIGKETLIAYVGDDKKIKKRVIPNDSVRYLGVRDVP